MKEELQKLGELVGLLDNHEKEVKRALPSFLRYLPVVGKVCDTVQLIRECVNLLRDKHDEQEKEVDALRKNQREKKEVSTDE